MHVEKKYCPFIGHVLISVDLTHLHQSNFMAQHCIDSLKLFRDVGVIISLILKFSTEHGSVTAVLCAKFQNEWYCLCAKETTPNNLDELIQLIFDNHDWFNDIN